MAVPVAREVAVVARDVVAAEGVKVAVVEWPAERVVGMAEAGTGEADGDRPLTNSQHLEHPVPHRNRVREAPGRRAGNNRGGQLEQGSKNLPPRRPGGTCSKAPARTNRARASPRTCRTLPRPGHCARRST